MSRPHAFLSRPGAGGRGIPTAGWWAEWPFLVPASLLLAAFGLSQIAFGERIPLGDGLGWDGRFYDWMARDLPQLLRDRALSAYLLQRALPPAIVHLVLRLLGLPRDSAHVVTTFTFCNLTLLLLSLFAWTDIARRTGLSVRGRWLGFLLLFANFANLRMAFYYPVLTDTTAFALGVFLVDAYVRASAGGLLLLALLGGFSWPSFLAFSALLLCFPRQPLRSQAPAPRVARWIAAGSAVLVFLAGLVWSGSIMDRRPWMAAVDESLLPISVVVAVAYVVAVTLGLLNQQGLFRPRTYRRAFRERRFLAWLGLVALSRLAVALLSNGRPVVTAAGFLKGLALASVTRPGLFLVAHAVYYGPLVLLSFLYWHDLCRAAHRLGLGMTLFTAALLALALNSESRILLHGVGALVLLAVIAMERVRWPAWGTTVVVAIALLASKFCFPINHGGFTAESNPYTYPSHGGFTAESNPYTYPSQYYYMNQGPWMTAESYVLQGSLALCAGLLLLLAGRRAHATASDAP